MSYGQLARYQQGYNNTPQSYWQTAQGKAYANQANPYADITSQLKSNLAGYNPSDPSKSTGIWASVGGYKAPDITDPNTISQMGAYRNMMQGDMNRSMSDYVRQAATAGAQRGGMALGGVAPAEATGMLGAIRDIGSQSTQLNRDALDYLNQNNRWNYSLQRNQMADWLSAQNALRAAVGDQANWDQARQKQMYQSYVDTPGAIMRGASYSDNADQAARQAQQQQYQYQQQVNNDQMWRNAVMGNAASPSAAMLPQSNLYYSYLMGQPTRRG